MIDRQLLNTVLEKLAVEPRTIEQARATLPEDAAQQATTAELADLAKRQSESARWRYGQEPWVQNAATGVGGAGIGAGIGAALGGKQAMLPGAIMGGFIALLARFFFKNQFDKAFQWINQTLQRPDAAAVFERVKKQIGQADQRAAQFLEQFDPEATPAQLDAYKKELDVTAKTTGERIKTTQKRLAELQKQLVDSSLNPQQRDALEAERQKVQSELTGYEQQARSQAGVRHFLESQDIQSPLEPKTVFSGGFPAAPQYPTSPKEGPATTAPQAKTKSGKPEEMHEKGAQTAQRFFDAPTPAERERFRQQSPMQRSKNQTLVQRIKQKTIDPAAELPGQTHRTLREMQEGLAEFRRTGAGIKDKFQQYQKPLMALAAMPMLVSTLNMFSRYGRSSQLGNIARALQQRGAAGNPYMAQQPMVQQNPYMAQAFRRNF